MDIAELLKKSVVYRKSGMENAVVTHDITYKEADEKKLSLDVYYPANYEKQSPLPAVLFVHGDAAWERLQSIKESGQYTSWGQLAAASGLIGITFTHRSTEGFTDFVGPTEDILDLFQYVQDHADDLNVDPARIAVWVCSAGGPTGLTALLHSKPEWARCLVAYYALMDLQGLEAHLREHSVETIRRFSAVSHLQDNPSMVPPILVVKAGLDRPHFNDSIDRFVSEAERLHIPVELITHPNGQHGFDLLDEDEISQEIIKETLTFFRKHLNLR